MMVRSCVSALAGMVTVGTPETAVTGARECPAALEAGGVVTEVFPGAAGAVCAGRLVCGGTAGGFGPKYFAQSKITAIESSDANTMRSSCDNLLFVCGSLTNAPLPV